MPVVSQTVLIAVGSNVCPEVHIPAAIEALSGRLGALRVSTWYWTRPLGREEQPRYVNGVVAAQTLLPLEPLLAELSRIEDRAGRVRLDGDPDAPRTLDLDLLLYGELVAASLRLPHPDLLARDFVLVPAAEVAPELIHPTEQRRLAALAAARVSGRPNIVGIAEIPRAGAGGAGERGVSAVRAVLLAAAMGLMAATIPAGSAAAPEQLLPAAAVSGAAVPGVPRAAGPGAWWRSAGRVLLLLGLGYALLSAYMFVFQSRFVYFPDRDLIADPGALRLAFEDVRVPTRDGGTIHGWFVPAGGSGRGVILKCHGNGGNISHRLESIYQFHRLGFATFIFDYRGYGRSPGRPSEDGTYRDVEAAWRYLTHDRGIPASRILVFGRSLGGAIAAWLASREAPGALVVESSFSSIPDIGREVYPFLPVRLLSRFSYNTRAAVHAARCPVIVVHSRDDEMISIRHGRAIFEAAPTPKAFIEIRGGHNEAFMTWPDYLARLDAAITPWFPKAGGTPPGEPSPAREQADRPLTGSGTAGGP